MFDMPGDGMANRFVNVFRLAVLVLDLINKVGLEILVYGVFFVAGYFEFMVVVLVG